MTLLDQRSNETLADDVGCVLVAGSRLSVELSVHGENFTELCCSCLESQLVAESQCISHGSPEILRTNELNIFPHLAETN